jgi:hypothetical protein
VTVDPDHSGWQEGQLLAALVEVWTDALQRECGPDSDLFELGGDSLTIVLMIGRISELVGSHVSLGAILDAPTPRQLDTLLRLARQESGTT